MQITEQRTHFATLLTEKSTRPSLATMHDLLAHNNAQCTRQSHRHGHLRGLLLRLHGV